MQLPQRGAIEWNLNTIVMLIGFMVGVVAWGSTWGRFTGDVAAMDQKFTREIQRIDLRYDQRRLETDQRWRDHDQLHKDRAADNAAKAATDNQRFQSLESETRKIENLTYRVTVQEQGAATLAKSVEELKAAVNSQASDIRVIRDILERQDPTRRRQPPQN